MPSPESQPTLNRGRHRLPLLLGLRPNPQRLPLKSFKAWMFTRQPRRWLTPPLKDPANAGKCLICSFRLWFSNFNARPETHPKVAVSINGQGATVIPSSQSARRFPSASARGRSAQRDPRHPGHLSLSTPSRDLAWHDGPGPRVPDGPEGSGEARPHGLRHNQGLPGGLGDAGLTDPGPPAGAHPPPGGPRLPGRPALPPRPPFSAFLSFLKVTESDSQKEIQMNNLFTLYARREPDLKTICPQRFDVVLYKDSTATTFYGRWPWYYSSCPRRNQKRVVVNCSRWNLKWI